MSIAFDLFCLMVSFKIPNSVELSVRRGVGDCVWTISVSVTLSGAPLWALWKHAPTYDSAAEATTFLMTEATLRMEQLSLSWSGGFVAQEKQTSEATSCVWDRKIRGIAVDVQDHVMMFIWPRVKGAILIVNHEVINIMSPIGSLVIV
jgi:hypothetical protein